MSMRFPICAGDGLYATGRSGAPAVRRRYRQWREAADQGDGAVRSLAVAETVDAMEQAIDQ